MKVSKILIVAALLVCGVAAILWAAQDTAITQRELRDPLQLETYLEANASDAQTRLAALEATAGAGAAVATKTSATEAQSEVVLTSISFTNVVLTATDGSDEGESQKVIDMDAGAFCLIMAVADLQCVTSAGSTNTFLMACGTAAAGDDNDLTSTEADVIPKTTIDTTGGTVLTNAFDAVIADPTVFDGTGTAKDIYVNFAIDDDNMNANVTNTITGTLYLYTTTVQDN